MKREWKPGDIAILRDSLLEWPAVKDVRGWSALAPHIGWVSDDDRFTVVRPLVVIDPEDREQVERLLVAYQAQYQHPSAEVERRTSKLQTALREFANPTPPRIDEPGTWGVVEASCPHSDTRRPWVHHPDGNWWPAFDYSTVPERTPLPDGWDDLIDPTLVREGVSA